MRQERERKQCCLHKKCWQGKLYNRSNQYCPNYLVSKVLLAKGLFEILFRAGYFFARELSSKYVFACILILYPGIKLFTFGGPLLFPGVQVKVASAPESEIDLGNSTSFFSASSFFYIKRFSARVFIDYLKATNIANSSEMQQVGNQRIGPMQVCCSLGLLPGYRINENLSINLGGVVYFGGSNAAYDEGSSIAEFSAIASYVSHDLHSYFEVRNKNHIRWSALVPLIKVNQITQLQLQFSGESIGDRSSLHAGLGIQYKQAGLHVSYDYIWQAMYVSFQVESPSGWLFKIAYTQKNIEYNYDELVLLGVTYKFLKNDDSSFSSSSPENFSENVSKKNYGSKNRKLKIRNASRKSRSYKKKRAVVPNFSTLINWGVSSKDALKILRSKKLCSGSIQSRKIIKKKGWKCEK